MKKSLLVIFLVLACDQLLKFYIKTNYELNEQHLMIGEWFKLHFIENEGMAFGWKIFEGSAGKLALSIFRIIAISGIGYYLYRIIQRKEKTGLIISISLIFAGAFGNLIDSAFYGLIFSESPYYGGVAQFMPEGGGYAGFLHGKVVDMFYFPLIEGYYPDWSIIPASMRGDHFIFFRPIFNLADAAITTGVLILLVFQKRLLPAELKNAKETDVAETTEETEIEVEKEEIQEEPTA